MVAGVKALHASAPMRRNRVVMMVCLQIYEEVRSQPKVVCRALDEFETFQQAQLQHGDVLLVQKALTEVRCICVHLLRMLVLKLTLHA